MLKGQGIDLQGPPLNRSGEKVSEETVDRVIETGEAENLFQKAFMEQVHYKLDMMPASLTTLQPSRFFFYDHPTGNTDNSCSPSVR